MTIKKKYFEWILLVAILQLTVSNAYSQIKYPNIAYDYNDYYTKTLPTKRLEKYENKWWKLDRNGEWVTDSFVLKYANIINEFSDSIITIENHDTSHIRIINYDKERKVKSIKSGSKNQQYIDEYHYNNNIISINQYQDNKFIGKRAYHFQSDILIKEISYHDDLTINKITYYCYNQSDFHKIKDTCQTDLKYKNICLIYNISDNILCETLYECLNSKAPVEEYLYSYKEKLLDSYTAYFSGELEYVVKNTYENGFLVKSTRFFKSNEINIETYSY